MWLLASLKGCCCYFSTLGREQRLVWGLYIYLESQGLVAADWSSFPADFILMEITLCDVLLYVLSGNVLVFFSASLPVGPRPCLFRDLIQRCDGIKNDRHPNVELCHSLPHRDHLHHHHLKMMHSLEVWTKYNNVRQNKYSSWLLWCPTEHGNNHLHCYIMYACHATWPWK